MALMTIKEAAERLTVSRSMVRKLIKKGILTRVGFLRVVRVRGEEVEQLLPPVERRGK